MRLGPFYGTTWRRSHGWSGSGFWFRIYGYGLHVSTRKREAAHFSERNGMHKAWYFCGLRLEVLKR